MSSVKDNGRPRPVNEGSSSPANPAMVNDRRTPEYTLEKLENRLRQVAIHTSTYVTAKDCRGLGIQCSTIDIAKGTVADAKPQFFKPLSRDVVWATLDRTQPWSEAPWSETEKTGCHAALEIADLLDYWLSWAPEFNDGTTSLIEQTKWRTRTMNTRVGEILYSRRSDADFWGKIVLDMNDAAVPHIICFLAGDTPFQSDCLLRSEMQCILCLAIGRVNLRRFSAHRYIPAVIVSASATDVRIIQGFVDKADQSVNVRCSQAIDFNDQQQWKYNASLLLSWLLAEPVMYSSDDLRTQQQPRTLGSVAEAKNDRRTTKKGFWRFE